MLLAPRSAAAVVVVAGLPGAGKTTLVASEPGALDSDALREAWAPRLAGLPYALWRPLMHAWHWIAIWRALKRPERVIVVRPFTAAWLRRAVLRRARRHHSTVHLVVVDATPEQARAGQRARGRTIRERAMRRHERRWARSGFAHEPWTSVTHVRTHCHSKPSAWMAAGGTPRRCNADVTSTVIADGPQTRALQAATSGGAWRRTSSSPILPRSPIQLASGRDST